jgi:hypothetical protein
VANEYRFHKLGVELIHDGEEDAPIRVYSLAAEVIHDGQDDAPLRIYHTGIEVIRHIADRYNCAFVDEGESIEDFSYTGAIGWGFVDDGGQVFDFTLKIRYLPNIEKNPYASRLPSTTEETSEYLHEQQRILREQHNITQAGDTTFDYGLLFQLYAREEFNLGSLGRFKHDQFGIIHARFCKLSGFIESTAQGKPVGWLQSRTSVDWVVTNDFSKSNSDLLAGICFFYDLPSDDMYGWVAVNGPNIGIIRLTDDEIPQIDDPLGWTESHRLAAGTNWSTLRLVAELGEPFIRPGQGFIRVERITENLIQELIDDNLGPVNESIGNLQDTVTAQGLTLSAYGQSIANLQQADLNFQAALDRESAARVRDIKSVRDAIQTQYDWNQEINEASNALRLEFSQALDAVAQVSTNAYNIAASVQSTVAGFDLSGLSNRVDAAESGVSFLTTRLVNFTVDWSSPVDGQVLISTHFTNSDGNDVWSWEGADFTLENLSDVDTTSSPPSDGDVLTWDTGSGLWIPATPTGGGGGGGSLTLIERRVLVAPSTSEVFSSLGSYENLIIKVNARSAQATTSGPNVCIRFNGDSGNNYSRQHRQMSGTTLSSISNVNESFAFISTIPGSSAPAGMCGTSYTTIFGYNRTTFHKGYIGRTVGRHGTGSGDIVHRYVQGFWHDTSAITSIELFDSNGYAFDTGTIFEIYGEV